MLRVTVTPLAYAKVKAKIIAVGGTVDPDGTIPIKPEGVVLQHAYNPQSGELTVSVLHKPWFASVSLVEGKVAEWITAASSEGSSKASA